MKKKIIIPIILILIVISLLIISLVNIFSTKIDKKNYLTDYIKVEGKDERVYLEENYIFTSLNELETIFNQNYLTEDDFNNSNYALLQIRYDPCSEKNIKLLGYTLKGNVLTAHIEYDQVCGGCAPEELDYLVKIPKKQTSIEIKYENKVNKKEHCDPNVAYKPMIYLYPKEDTNIKVSLKNKNLLTLNNTEIKGNIKRVEKNINEFYKENIIINKNNVNSIFFPYLLIHSNFLMLYHLCFVLSFLMMVELFLEYYFYYYIYFLAKIFFYLIYCY